MNERVAVIGLGYIGLPTAGLLASHGMIVLGVDNNPHVVETVNKGLIHITEPDLDAIIQVVVGRKLLRAATKPEPADAFIIAVPTPFLDGKPDMSHIEHAARAIAPVLRAGNLVILESTCPVGTTENMCRLMAELRPDLNFPVDAGRKIDISVAYCPERVLPGMIMHELEHNDRVIGGMTEQCGERAVRFYRSFCKGACLRTSVRTAELCKLAENAFRDVNIAFANELSLICDRFGVNVWELTRLANHHPRVKILQPGPGVGGHCIAVDPWFIVSSAPEQARLIRAAREVNDSKPIFVLKQIRSFVDELKSVGLARPGVACLGLTFKADVDDIRESPALAISEGVMRWGDCDVFVAEPNLRVLPGELAGKNHVIMKSAPDVISSADIVALLVNHREFSQIEPASLISKKIVDTRGMWS